MENEQRQPPLGGTEFRWCPSCGEGMHELRWPLRCTDCDIWFCGHECIDDPKGHPCKRVEPPLGDEELAAIVERLKTEIWSTERVDDDSVEAERGLVRLIADLRASRARVKELEAGHCKECGYGYDEG